MHCMAFSTACDMIYKIRYVASRPPVLKHLALTFLLYPMRPPKVLSSYRNILMNLVRTP